MLQEGQIIDIIGEVVPLLKEYYGYSVTDKKRKLPEYNPVYTDTVELQREIAVHAELRDFPEKLFKAKAPNESEEQWGYRKENYQPVTMPFWNKALAVMNRIWNTNNYELKWGDKEVEYFTKGYPEYSNILAFFESVVTRYKVNDPNALLCVKPWYLPTMEKDGEIIPDDTKEIDAIAQIYSCDKVIKFERDYVMILMDEKSLVNKGGAETYREGLVFELYDDTNIWKIIQVGKQSDWTFQAIIYYPHNLGYIPAQRLKGMPLTKGGNIYYKSVLYDAIPLLNEALYDSSTHSISKVGAAFPVRWAYSEVCQYMGSHGERCDKGRVSVSDGKDGMKYVECPGCRGTGFTHPFTPMGVMYVKAPSNNLDTDSVPTPPMGFASPDVNILKYLGEESYSNIIRAFSMLNIDVSNSTVKGSETALGKQIDREELFSFIQTFSSEAFDLLGFTINSIGKIRFTNAWKPPQISKPVNFAIRSEADLMTEIAQARESGQPEIVLRRLYLEFISIRFTDSAQASTITDLIMKVDSLFTYSPESIIAALGSGYAQKWETELHKNIFIYIEEEIETDTGFLSKKFSEQRIILIAKAKASVAASAPLKAEGILDAIE